MTLEKFIQNHRNELDKFEPSGKVWTNIEEKLNLDARGNLEIERFTKSNKEKLNNYETPSGLWEKIEAELSSDKSGVVKSKIIPLKKRAENGFGASGLANSCRFPTHYFGCWYFT